jgi:hypothetical protein
MNTFCSLYVLYLYNKSQAFSGSGGGAVVRIFSIRTFTARGPGGAEIIKLRWI